MPRKTTQHLPAFTSAGAKVMAIGMASTKRWGGPPPRRLHVWLLCTGLFLAGLAAITLTIMRF